MFFSTIGRSTTMMRQDGLPCKTLCSSCTNCQLPWESAQTVSVTTCWVKIHLRSSKGEARTGTLCSRTLLWRKEMPWTCWATWRSRCMLTRLSRSILWTSSKLLSNVSSRTQTTSTNLAQNFNRSWKTNGAKNTRKLKKIQKRVTLQPFSSRLVLSSSSGLRKFLRGRMIIRKSPILSTKRIAMKKSETLKSRALRKSRL